MRNIAYIIAGSFILTGLFLYKFTEIRDMYIQSASELENEIIEEANELSRENGSISLEKVKEFIYLSSTKDLALIVIDALAVFVVFILILSTGMFVYYELRLKKALNNSNH